MKSIKAAFGRINCAGSCFCVIIISMNIVLASTSPRRRELIKRITEVFTAAAADVDEKSIVERIEAGRGRLTEAQLAEKTVRELSKTKALAVFTQLGSPEDTVVIGADTVVALENEILGKPADRNDAVRMLRAQSMEPQQVMTGVTLVYKGCFGCGQCCRARAEKPSQVLVRTFVEKTLVYFHPLDEAQEARIQAYCDTEEPYDKAGAYGIQQNGGVLVERYEGDYDNIVGFPVERVKKELASLLNKNVDKQCN